jgi:hypothetical protein
VPPSSVGQYEPSGQPHCTASPRMRS